MNVGVHLRSEKEKEENKNLFLRNFYKMLSKAGIRTIYKVHTLIS